LQGGQKLYMPFDGVKCCALLGKVHDVCDVCDVRVKVEVRQHFNQVRRHLVPTKCLQWM